MLNPEPPEQAAHHQPGLGAWATLVTGLIIVIPLNLLAVAHAEHPAPRPHLVGAVALPALLLAGALGWNLAWPARIVRDIYAVALALLIFANVATFYTRTQAVLASTGYPSVVSYPTAALGWPVIVAGFAVMWPGGPVRPKLFKLRQYL